MTTKADDLATETINFPYLVSPASVSSNLGYANKRPRITKALYLSYTYIRIA